MACGRSFRLGGFHSALMAKRKWASNIGGSRSSRKRLIEKKLEGWEVAFR